MNISRLEDISADMDEVNESLDRFKRTFQTTSDRLKNEHLSLMKNTTSYLSRNGYEQNMTSLERAMSNMERVKPIAQELQEKSLLMIRKTEEVMSVLSEINKTVSNSYVESNTLQRRAKNVVKTQGLVPVTAEQQMAFVPGDVYPLPSPSGERKGGKKKRKAKKTRKRY